MQQRHHIQFPTPSQNASSYHSPLSFPLTPHSITMKSKHHYTTPLFLLSTTFLLLTSLALVLAITILRQRRPTITLVSATLTSLSPSITLTTSGSLLLNATLHLELLLRNPNRASFHHDSPGTTLLLYKGTRIGGAELAPGCVHGRGRENVTCNVSIEAEGLSSEMGKVVKDVGRGELGFEAKSRVEGRVALLWFVRRRVTAEADCYVVIGLGPIRVLRHECSSAPS